MDQVLIFIKRQSIILTTYEFIFSEKAPERYVRHVVFWLIFALHVFFFRYYVFNPAYLLTSATYLVRVKFLVLSLPVSVFYAYFAIYFLLPRYILTEKYGRLLLIVFILSILLMLFSRELSILFDIKLAWDLPSNRDDVVRIIDFTFNNGLVYPLTVSGFAIGIKMSKNFYIQQKQNERLAIQKINADVQLLKSQVYPRFLFHSLQTIYDDMLNGSEKSPGMLLKLSDLLSYLLYESDKVVPLEKELLLLRNYIDLEKISWGNQLSVNINDDIDTNRKSIQPLLLLPLVEYIFEKLDKDRQGQVLLKIIMQMEEPSFIFRLIISGLSKCAEDTPKENVHLFQLRKRLQVHYAEKHELMITTGQDYKSIFLSLVPEVSLTGPMNRRSI